jgi:TetR/AcrR family transcriptional repressor of bet genes
MRQCVETAGLAPGLIHDHFKNKEETLLDLVKSLAFARQRYDGLAAPDAGADAQSVAACVIIGTGAIRQAQVRAACRDVVTLHLVTRFADVAPDSR